jgi:prepilin-type N-terminal cleavage/methylation domain-containing protein
MGKRRHSGFTLIELVLVIGLISILSVAVYASFPNVGQIKVETAAHKISQDITFARRLARNRNGIFGVSFDAAADTYRVYLFDPATSTETPVIDPLTRGSMTVNLRTFPGLEGVDIQNPSFGGTTGVRFPPQGIPQNGNGVNLAAAGSVQLVVGSAMHSVSVQPRTGEVSQQ